MSHPVPMSPIGGRRVAHPNLFFHTVILAGDLLRWRLADYEEHLFHAATPFTECPGHHAVWPPATARPRPGCSRDGNTEIIGRGSRHLAWRWSGAHTSDRPCPLRNRCKSLSPLPKGRSDCPSCGRRGYSTRVCAAEA